MSKMSISEKVLKYPKRTAGKLSTGIDQFLHLGFQPDETLSIENNVQNGSSVMCPTSNSKDIRDQDGVFTQDALIVTNGSPPADACPIDIDDASDQRVGHGESLVCVGVER
jgi:hypothetical protein